MQKDLYKRIARIEAISEIQKASLDSTIESAYHRACEEKNEEEAARLLRKMRNNLLDRSDKEMTLDRIGLDVSSPTKFIASLSKIVRGDWAKYRQDLRDITKQPGFPFDVVFPDTPGATFDQEEGGEHYVEPYQR